eukprot:1142075-Pelagomonas_calceolata.AAC.4
MQIKTRADQEHAFDAGSSRENQEKTLPAKKAASIKEMFPHEQASKGLNKPFRILKYAGEN